MKSQARKMPPDEAGRLREEGRQEGVLQGRMEILSWLEKRYLEDEGRPDRDSPEGQAMLKLAREAGQYLRNLGVVK
jgi:hypothetical protein